MQSSPSSLRQADFCRIPLEIRIARQAHVLWGGFGRPEVRDVMIWFDPQTPGDSAPGGDDEAPASPGAARRRIG